MMLLCRETWHRARRAAFVPTRLFFHASRSERLRHRLLKVELAEGDIGMDRETAAKILGVDAQDDSGKVRLRYLELVKRYHPDNLDTGNQQSFILVYTAYLVIKSSDVGLATGQGTHSGDNYHYAQYLRNRITGYFDDIVNSLKRDLREIEQDTLSETDRLIMSAKSLDGLKLLLGGRIKDRIVDATAEIHQILIQLDERVGKRKGEFVFDLFGQMYAARRKYWLISLYRNPVVVGEGVIQTLLLILRETNYLGIASADAGKFLTSSWLWIGLLGAGLAVLLIQLLALNPRRQYLPPRISLASLQTFMTHLAGSIGTSKGALAAGGAAIGAVVGSFLLPVIGTVIGGLVGSLWGLAGDDLEEKRIEVRDGIRDELGAGLRQIERHVGAWARKATEDIYAASLDSFDRNVRKFANRLGFREVKLIAKMGGPAPGVG
ncbi:MAG TPA: J domain-containing protein [Allosphingosinicella sp.]|nr:J domain-containing protein [Allosphingosinicella sp.]